MCKEKNGRKRKRKMDRNKREEIKKCSKTRTETEILTCKVKKCLFSVGHILLSDTEFKGEGPAPSGSRPPLYIYMIPGITHIRPGKNSGGFRNLQGHDLFSHGLQEHDLFQSWSTIDVSL